jgi:putative heme-binding domain-containing protein
VVTRFADAARLRPNPENGRTLFEQNCAQCHRHRGLGAEVGPDLGIMTGKSIEQVIVAVLDPNAAVEERFRSYSVTTRDDRDLTGVIVSETPTSVTLRAANQPDETVLRGDITEFVGSGLSLMPEGFESAFTTQQLADLAAFVLGQ